jgi:hypothetical protein
MEICRIDMRKSATRAVRLASVVAVLGWSGYALAADTGSDALTALESQGYKVVTKTIAKGEFTGCEFNRQVPFRNGMVFVCLGDSRGRAYEPDVTILRDDNGDVRVLIDGEEYRGTLIRE